MPGSGWGIREGCGTAPLALTYFWGSAFNGAALARYTEGSRVLYAEGHANYQSQGKLGPLVASVNDFQHPVMNGYGAEHVVQVRRVLASGFVRKRRILSPEAGRLLWQQRDGVRRLLLSGLQRRGMPPWGNGALAAACGGNSVYPY